MKSAAIILALMALVACSDYTPVEKNVAVDPEARTVTLPQPCPDWSAPTENYDNSVHSNFGCAAKRNMVVQLDDPADYVRGHGDKKPDTENTIRTIGRYRAGEIPAPLVPLSDVGQ
jgi:type IV pilus biogenesis protein CpaD/CtpE